MFGNDKGNTTHIGILDFISLDKMGFTREEVRSARKCCTFFTLLKTEESQDETLSNVQFSFTR